MTKQMYLFCLFKKPENSKCRFFPLSLNSISPLKLSPCCFFITRLSILLETLNPFVSAFKKAVPRHLPLRSGILSCPIASEEWKIKKNKKTINSIGFIFDFIVSFLIINDLIKTVCKLIYHYASNARFGINAVRKWFVYILYFLIKNNLFWSERNIWPRTYEKFRTL